MIQWATMVLGLPAIVGSWWTDVDSLIGRAWFFCKNLAMAHLSPKKPLSIATQGDTMQRGWD